MLAVVLQALTTYWPIPHTPHADQEEKFPMQYASGGHSVQLSCPGTW
jgi:hypothetical protein